MDNLLFNNLINNVLTNSNISDVIGNSIKLVRSGNKITAICPFHNDHNPSLSISNQKKIFKCFACGVGGNAITFVQKFYKIGFIEAITRIDAQFNLKIADLAQLNKQKNPTWTKFQQKLIIIITEVMKYFHYLLVNTLSDNHEAAKYCRERKLTTKIIVEFNIGFAPNRSSEIIDFCHQQKFDLDDCVTAGILYVVKNKYYSYFRNRIIFPILTPDGEVVGFSGRAISNFKQTSKYINSPETPIFHKQDLLFNLNRVKRDCSTNDIILTEGFMDVIMLTVSGFPNCVATMGTSIHARNIATLTKYNRKITLAFNNDAAGLKTTIDVISLCLQQDCHPNIVDFSHNVTKQFNDIDEMFCCKGSEGVKRLISGKTHFFQFITEIYRNRFRSLTSRRQFLYKVLHVLNSLPQNSIIDKMFFINEWAKVTNIKAAILQKSLSSFPSLAPHSVNKTSEKRELLNPLNYQEILTKVEIDVLSDFVRRWNATEIYYWFSLEHSNYSELLSDTFRFIDEYTNNHFNDVQQWKNYEYMQLLERNVHHAHNKLSPHIVKLFEALIVANNQHKTDLITPFYMRKNKYLCERRAQWINKFNQEYGNILNYVNNPTTQQKIILQQMTGNKNTITNFKVLPPPSNCK